VVSFAIHGGVLACLLKLLQYYNRTIGSFSFVTEEEG